ncbi:MAG: tyrosine-type recombinase/integrase [Butyrivibrio sp.]
MANITKRGNTYSIRVSCGRDVNNKQIIQSTTWTPDPEKTTKQNEKALNQFAMEFEMSVKSGKYLDGERITFQEFSKKWLQEYANVQLEKTTVAFYESMLNIHILPVIGHLKLARIQPSHLNKLYIDMLTHRNDGKTGGYSPTTIKRVHATICSIMSTAMQWNVILNNPCERVRPPKQVRTPKDVQFFTIEQTAAFLDELEREATSGTIKLQHNIFLQLAIFCGMRRGEAIALTWQDIDFSKNTVSISKSTAIVHGKPITKAPKNESSVRTIAVPDHIMKMLRRYRIEYNTYRLSIGSQWSGNDYVFIQWNGAQMYPSTPYFIFKKIISRYNAEHEEHLPEIPLHGLRHTSATLLISQNVDVRTVSNRLGHAQTSTTMNIYSHSLQKKDTAAANTLENLFQDRKHG